MVTPVGSCVFCDIVNGQAPADVIRETVNSLIIVPLNPVVAGHVMVWHCHGQGR